MNTVARSNLNSNITEFNALLQRWAREKPAATVKKAQTLIGLAALRGVVMKTPVDTGYARANWQVTLNSPATGLVSIGFDERNGSRGGTSANAAAATSLALGSGSKTIQDAPAFSFIWLTNNVPYIQVLEFGEFEPPNPGPSKDPRPYRLGRILVENGFSVQAPNGMVALTIAELKGIFR